MGRADRWLDELCDQMGLCTGPGWCRDCGMCYCDCRCAWLRDEWPWADERGQGITFGRQRVETVKVREGYL